LLIRTSAGVQIEPDWICTDQISRVSDGICLYDASVVIVIEYGFITRVINWLRELEIAGYHADNHHIAVARPAIDNGSTGKARVVVAVKKNMRLPLESSIADTMALFIKGSGKSSFSSPNSLPRP